MVETGQENVRQPRNPAVEAKKAQVEAKVEAKTAKQKKYEDAPGEVITNVKEFKR